MCALLEVDPGYPSCSVLEACVFCFLAACVSRSGANDDCSIVHAAQLPVPRKLPLQVAPVDDVVFNNLVCARLPLQGPSQAPAPAPTSSQQYVAAPMMANASIPSPIYIEYAPVVYLHNQPSSGSDEWQSDLNSLITFLVRCKDPMHKVSKFIVSYCPASAQTLSVPDCILQAADATCVIH